MKNFSKTPRIYCDTPLCGGGVVPLSESQVHYLGNVLRLQDGNPVRVFNGRDGEWVGSFQKDSKKKGSLVLSGKIKGQFGLSECHLIFAPIKKNRMDILVEKAVELGVTHLHPVLTQNTEVRKINEDRVRAQIIEAAEQCERMDVPQLETLQPLERFLQNNEKALEIAFAVERYQQPTQPLIQSSARAILIGPEGGFTEEEKITILNYKNIRPVSLGQAILRAETAVIAALSLMNLGRENINTGNTANQ